MAAYKGIGLALGLAVETTYGTAVTPATNWIPLTSVSGPGVTKNYVENPLLSDQPTREQPVNVRSEWAQTVTTNLSYQGLGLLWYYATGVTPVTTGAGPYTHVYELSTTLPTSLTAETKRGTAANADVAEGVKVDRLRISGSVDQYITISADLIGETSNAAAVGTPAYATTRTSAGSWQVGDVSWNSGTYCPNAFEITIERNHSRPGMMGCTVEPVNDYAKVSGRFTFEYDGEDWYAGLRAETVDDADFTITSGADSIRFDLQNLVIKGVTRDVSDGGRIMQTVEFECYADGTKTGIKITNVNGQTNYNDN